MADSTDHGLVFHLLHLRERDHVGIAGCADVNVAAPKGLFDGRYFIAFHRCLEGINRIDLGDDYARALATQRLCATFTDIAVPTDDRDLARDHDIESAVQSINQRMAAAIEIVELRFSD